MAISPLQDACSNLSTTATLLSRTLQIFLSCNCRVQLLPLEGMDLGPRQDIDVMWLWTVLSTGIQSFVPPKDL